MVQEVSTLLKIVTVEDSSIIVDRVVNMLREISGVTFAGNAETIPDAIELIRIQRPEIVILDINLRSEDGKNGINLLNILRKLYPTMTIIMLTNLTDIHYRNLCKDYGADYFFDKSHDFDKIPDTVSEIIELRQSAG